MERSNERFGKTVVDLGWVSPMEMPRAVAAQIKDIIYSVFTWYEGDYRFEVSDDPVSDDLALEVHTAEVIYEGACRISDSAAIRAGVGSWKNTLVLADGKRLGIPVTQDDGYILSRVDGIASIGDIVATSPLGEEETLRRIYALLLAGVVEIGDPEKRPHEVTVVEEDAVTEDERHFRDAVLARHAALQFGNYYDWLGVDLDASGKRVRAAYEEVMASLEPQARFGIASAISKKSWPMFAGRFGRPTKSSASPKLGGSTNGASRIRRPSRRSRPTPWCAIPATPTRTGRKRSCPVRRPRRSKPSFSSWRRSACTTTATTSTPSHLSTKY